MVECNGKDGKLKLLWHEYVLWLGINPKFCVPYAGCHNDDVIYMYFIIRVLDRRDDDVIKPIGIWLIIRLPDEYTGDVIKRQYILNFIPIWTVIGFFLFSLHFLINLIRNWDGTWKSVLKRFRETVPNRTYLHVSVKEKQLLLLSSWVGVVNVLLCFYFFENEVISIFFNRDLLITNFSDLKFGLW